MKSYEILDEANFINIGVLLYYEKAKEFIIELNDNLDEWTAPLLFTSFVKKGIFTIPRDISLLWVKERVIPSGRQNIGSILSNHKLKAYDEMKLLELAEGRCSQDSMFIRKIDDLPEFVLDRQKKNLIDCTPLDSGNILCFFADNSVKKVELKAFSNDSKIEKVIKNNALFNSCKIGTGGYCATFNDSIDIPSWELYDKGITIPLSYQDFLTFADRNLFDTSESCQELKCSRQNITYLNKQGLLNPVKENVKGNLYLKGDVIKTRW